LHVSTSTKDFYGILASCNQNYSLRPFNFSKFIYFTTHIYNIKIQSTWHGMNLKKSKRLKIGAEAVKPKPIIFHHYFDRYDI
jgi:hypothetical protein